MGIDPKKKMTSTDYYRKRLSPIVDYLEGVCFFGLLIFGCIPILCLVGLFRLDDWLRERAAIRDLRRMSKERKNKEKDGCENDSHTTHA